MAPETAGRVVETPVNVGDFVKQGQVIARLEDRDAKLRLDQAQAQTSRPKLRCARRNRASVSVKGRTSTPTTSLKCSRRKPLTIPPLAQAQTRRSRRAALRESDQDRRCFAKRLRKSSHAGRHRGGAGQFGAPAVRSHAECRAPELSGRDDRAGFARRGAGANGDGAESDGRYTDPRAVRRIRQRAARLPAGQYVALTSKIATVLRITPIKLELQVPESNAPQMRAGGAGVEATVPGYPGRDLSREESRRSIPPSIRTRAPSP